jgi:hypothetical protein
LLAALLLAPASAPAGIAFTPGAPVPVAASPEFIATGDLNRDGFAQELSFSGQLSGFSSRHFNGSLRNDGG